LSVKAVVVLAGARDQYQVPLALREADLLQSLVTDLYWPADKTWFNNSAGAILPSRAIAARYCAGLDSDHVRVSRKALCAIGLMRGARTLRWNRYVDKTLSRKAKEIALRENAALLCYSYYAGEAFKPCGDVSSHRFLFQLHPHPEAVRAILREELMRVPRAKFSLLSEHELSLSPEEFADLADEPHLANGWVTASRFTAQTLIDRGVPEAQVHVIPYGVDHLTFARRPVPRRETRAFTVVFVGSLSQRKGITYLLDAVRSLQSREVRLLLCGRGIIDTHLLARYSDIEAELHIGSSQADLIRFMQSADLLVLPSLAEGFGHVILEAMSCGLPVVATPHTCAPDVIEDGKHGFIVPVRDSCAIAERLEWCLQNREELIAMGDAAADRARSFTWERFRGELRDAYDRMVTGRTSEIVFSAPGGVRAVAGDCSHTAADLAGA